ncbi:MAG: NAD(P)-dependent oxidoreductase [Polaromonas sp.]|nr:NAD(P)-dependent oxidoreductase [Polaromonas sp.]
MRQAHEELKHETALDWSFASPPSALAAGERSGSYRLGGDDLLPGTSSKQPVGISVADPAVAIGGEIEAPCPVKRRFPVAR